MSLLETALERKAQSKLDEMKKKFESEIELLKKNEQTSDEKLVSLESILKELETSKDVYLFPKPILYDL